MTSLPEWINRLNCGCTWYGHDQERIIKALVIAWEALERMNNPKFCICKKRAEEAMRRIEELGK